MIALLVVGGATVFGVTQYQKKKAAEEYAQRVEEYSDNLNLATVTMLTGASDAESSANLIKQVWYNAIYEKRDDETDKYTRPKGYFVSDFNDALGNLYADSSFSSKVSVYWDLYDKNHMEAIRKYDGHMFCPICKLAPLTVARGNQRRYFKVIESDTEKHDIDCPYRHKMASKKETNNFYKDLDTTDIINRVISCLNRMLKKVFNNMDGNGLLVRGEKKSKNNFFDFNGNGGERKYLPHKNFNSGNLKEDMDIQKIYYGKCALYIYKYIPKGGADIKMYYLKILSRNSKKQICEISISPYVYNYLSNELTDIPEERDEALNYYLCFSGILEKNKYSYKCKLKDSRLLVLEKK